MQTLYIRRLGRAWELHFPGPQTTLGMARSPRISQGKILDTTEGSSDSMFFKYGKH